MIEKRKHDILDSNKRTQLEIRKQEDLLKKKVAQKRNEAIVEK